MSELNEIKRLITESEGLELSNWNTATHAQREAWASIETQGRAWIIDFITTIESQNSQIESLKAITELAVNALKEISDGGSTGEDARDMRRTADITISEIERLQNDSMSL